MSPNLIGIDAGGTYIKAALFDEHGVELALEKAPNNNVFLSGGRCERDADLMMEAVYEATGALLARPGVAAEDIAAVAVTGFGCGLWLLDEDGHALHNGIVSTDSRTAADVDALDPAVRRTIEGRVGSVMWPGLTLPLLAWITRRHPELAARTQRIVSCKDYIRGHLTGDFSTDFTDAGFTGISDITRGDWATDVLDLLGLAEWVRTLPEIGTGTDVVGRITGAAAECTGLRPGTPVVRGVLDVTACALASGVTDPSKMSIIAGTFGNNQSVHAGRPRSSTPPLAQAPYIEPGTFLATEGGATSASNFEWVVQQLFRKELHDAAHGGAGVYEQCNRWVAEAYEEVRPGGALFFPYLFGGPAPAGLVGIDAHTELKDVVLPVYEGIAFAHKANVDRLRAGDDAAAPTVARMAGGGSNSDIWPQIFADVLEIDIEVTAANEMGALGSAMVAAVGVGLYDGLDAAVDGMVRVARNYTPNRERLEQTRARYQLHTRVGAALAQAVQET